MTEPVLWPVEPHTAAKHQILKRYLQAWMPIITRAARRHPRVYYFDGFAGPGEYVGGEPGSPTVAIESALEHTQTFPIPVHMTFIEADDRRASHLEGVLARYKEQVERSPNIELHREVKRGDCAGNLNQILDRLEAQSAEVMPPCLFFLDQFGYSMAPMELLARILGHRMCEVFALIEWNRLNQTMSDSDKWAAISRAFGGDRWKPALKLSGADRQEFLVSEYRDAMERAGARFTWHFSMRDRFNKLIYWLFFGSGGIDGLEQMKKAMKRIDPSGEYCFSDFHEGRGQRYLFEYSDEMLAADLSRDLGGMTRSISQIRHHVLTKTPGVNYSRALALLERKKGLEIQKSPPNRRAGSFLKYQTDDPPLMVTFR